MTLLVIAPDYASHALPLMTLAESWRDRGTRVVVATGPAVAPDVERAGMEWIPLAMSRGSNSGIARPEDQPPGEDDNLRAFFAATREGMVATLRYQAEARARDLLWAPANVARRTIEIVEEVRPDAIIADHLAFAATLGLRAAEVPYADVVLGHPRQLPVAGETYGIPSAWPRAFAPEPRDFEALESVARGVASRFTDAYNDALHELSAHVALVEDAFAAHGSVVLLNYPHALHERARTASLPGAHAFLGATVRSEQPSTEVKAWLVGDADRPLVLVSLGTFLSARDDVLGVIAAGLRQMDVRVAMATGSTDPRRLGPLPPDWLVQAYLPQVAILDRAAALVTHAGNNSVTEAMAHGVPMLALPFSTDQFDGAAAIEEHGIGEALDPNRLRPEEVALGVRSLIDAPNERLRALSTDVRSRSGPDVAFAAVHEWLTPTARV